METLKKVSIQTTWQLIGKVITVISTFVVLGIITRHFGSFGTGLYTLTLTFLAFFYLACDLGFNAYVLPRIEKSLDEANDLLNFRIVWGLILILVAIILSFFIPTEDKSIFILSVTIGAVTIVFSGIFNSFNLIFQKNLKYNLSITASSVGAVINIPIILYLASINAPIYFLILASVVGWLVNNIVGFILVRRLIHFRFNLNSLTYGFKVLLKAWPISLTLVLNIIYFRVDTFILNAYYGFSITGEYNLAYQVFQNALVVPTFIMNGFYPIMITTFNKSSKIFWKQISWAVVFLFLISITGSILTFYLSPLVIQLLTGGGFDSSVNALRILSFSFPAYFLSALFMWVFLVLKKYKLLAGIYIFGLIVNLILNFYLIPKYSYIAASFVTGVCEYLILILQVVILLRLIKSSRS